MSFVTKDVTIVWEKGHYPTKKSYDRIHKDSLVYKEIFAIVLVNHFPPGNVWNGYRIYSLRTKHFVTKLGSQNLDTLKKLCEYLLKDYYGVFRQDDVAKFQNQMYVRYGTTSLDQMEEWLKELTFKNKPFYPLTIKVTKEVEETEDEQE